MIEQNKIVTPQQKEQYLADLKKFREAIPVKGEPLSTTIINARKEERY